MSRDRREYRLNNCEINRRRSRKLRSSATTVQDNARIRSGYTERKNVPRVNVWHILIVGCRLVLVVGYRLVLVVGCRYVLIIGARVLGSLKERPVSYKNVSSA